MYAYVWGMCICFMYVYMFVNVFRGQRSILGGFLYYWSHYFIKMESFIDTGAHQWAGLAG